MKKKFWTFVHDRLEDAWHWVYYHKLAEPLPPIVMSDVRYHVSYSVGKTAMIVSGPDVGKNEKSK